MDMADLVPRSPAGRLAGLYGERFLGLGMVKGVGSGKLLLLTPVRGRIQRVEITEVIQHARLRWAPRRMKISPVLPRHSVEERNGIFVRRFKGG